MKLEMYDIEEGMLVTVVKGKKYKPPPSLLGNEETEVREDNSYKGDVLEVKAIDLPFAVFENHNNPIDRPLDLDLREWGLKNVTEEYAEAQGVDTDGKLCRMGKDN